MTIEIAGMITAGEREINANLNLKIEDPNVNKLANHIDVNLLIIFFTITNFDLS